MNITLVMTSFNDEVHGTFNDKRTGCGINMLKPENVTRYRRGGKMTDLGELTCERCKARIAKEMIKSDQKEMKAILKEERLRAKKGIEDEGIIPLGNTTAKITSAQNVPPPQPAPAPEAVQPAPAPTPAPEPPKPAYQPNGAPALNDDLAQFAIQKPVEEEKKENNYFEAERPNLFESEPAPVPAPQPETPPVDDFLAQFAIQKPDEPQQEETQNDEADFLAQFAVSGPATEEAQPVETAEPAAPPVIDDISAALQAMEQNSYIPQQPKAPEPAPAPEVIQPAPVQTAPAPVKEEKQAHNYENDWDTLANQLFSGVENAVQPAVEATKPVVDTIQPAVEEIKAPVLEDIGENISEAAPVQTAPVDEIKPAVEEITAPVLEDIGEDIPEITAPVQPAPVEEIKPVQLVAEEKPVIDDISAAISAMNIPAAPKAAPINDDLVLEDISDDDDDDAFELISPDLEPKEEKAPVLDDISEAISAMNIPAAAPAPAPVKEAPAPVQSAPVIDDISSALSALNAQPTPVGAVPSQSAPVQPAPVPVKPVAAPVQPAPVSVQPVAAPVQPAPAPVQPVVTPVQPAPAPVQPTPVTVKPVPVQTAAPNPAAPAGTPGQVISVPQITGYDSLNQPIYSYIQMQIQGYDQNGQPVLVPLPGQNIPVPTATTFSQRFNQNTRLRDAIAAAQEIPTSTKDMTPGQRIAAADAAKGTPISANVSKIATNAHTKSTSQAFISAISESKEYANQSLTETQGLQQRTSVLNSVEDVLSQLGDNSLKEKKLAEAKAQTNVPTYQEYKAPTQRSAYAPRPAAAPVARPAQPDDRFLTKSELKAKKKQDKIDAKFQRDMAKRK